MVDILKCFLSGDPRVVLKMFNADIIMMWPPKQVFTHKQLVTAAIALFFSMCAVVHRARSPLIS